MAVGGATHQEAAALHDQGGGTGELGDAAAGERAFKAAAGREVVGGGFFQRCLAEGRGSTPEQYRFWRDAVYERISERTESLQGQLTVEQRCGLAQVSRAGYYRSLQEKAPAEEAQEVRAAVQKVVLEHRRRYGYRRVTAELRRQGMAVNHKRVARMMREDHLLALRQRAWVVTTESGHSLPVYVNLARRMELSAPDQLWVADITYIRLRQEFVFLAVVVDGFSRRAVGWALDRSLQTRLTLQALEMAAAQRRPAPGVVHHSDQGVQYAAAEYVARLAHYPMTASMSRPGNPFDNAQCESFIKTLKQEEIDCRKYRDLEDLRSHVREFIEEYYNCRRLHSALGYRSPAEFEAAGRSSVPLTESAAVVKLSFQGMGRSIHPISERPEPAVSARGPAGPDPSAHRTDESPADYSSASCSPAEPASASSAGLDGDRTE